MPNENFTTDTVEVDGETFEVHRGSGNVFEDLGFENADEMMLKSGLAIEILRVKKARRLTQREIAAFADLKTADVSDILSGRLDGVSVERLFKTLNRLGRSIEIRVASEDREDARTLVCA